MKIKPGRAGSVAGALILLAQGLAVLPANAAPDPALAWTQTDMTVSGYQGTVIDAPVDFTYSGSITKPAVKVAGQFADSVTVDLTQAQPTSAGHASATIHVELPATQSASYVDNLQFTVNGQPVPQPLHLTVTPKPLDPNAVPDDLGFPSSSRITTLEGSSVVSDQLIVYVAQNDPAPEQTIKQVAASVSGFVVSSSAPERRYEIRVPGSTIDATIGLRAKVAAMPNVAAADVDVLDQEFGYTNDPIWQPTPSSHTDQNWNLTQIDAPDAWNTTNGNGVSVALIDGGVYAPQKDLSGRIDHEHDEEVPGSYVGHGTHVSGTMCAQGDNGIGTVGVAWGCKLSVYGIYATLTGTVNTRGIFSRVDEIVALAPADSPKIVNLSLGNETRFDCTSSNLTPNQQLILNQIVNERNAMIQRLQARPDILWVFASGDHGQDSSCSAYGALGNRDDMPNVVSVAASGIKGDLTDYSVRGSGVTVAAPGGYLHGSNSEEGVYSTQAPCALGQYLFYICPEYGTMSGTSMSAPHIAGIAALAFAARPGITTSQVKTCIASGATQGGKQVAQGLFIANANLTVACAKVPPAGDVLHGISDLSVSMDHSLAVANNGLVYSWGSNNSGQLGFGNTSDASKPQWLTALDSVTSVAVGNGGSFAIKSDGSLWGWGDNSSGQLGTGAGGNTLSPVQVAGIPAAKSIMTGTYEPSTIMTGADGSVWAWGQNREGELGIGSRSAVTVPTKVNVPVPVSEVVSGYWTNYAVGTDGSVWAWGDNSYGQLGDGTTNPALTPQRVPGVDSVKQIASGGAYETTYALRTDGSVVAWGKTGADGKLITPHQITISAPVAQLAAGGDVVFARTTADRLFAWGNGYCGSLGIGQDGNVSTPTQITGGGVGQGLVMNVATTDYGNSTYAVLSDGTVWAWGAGGDGEMGNGTSAACTATPTQVSNLNTATQIFTAEGAFGGTAAAFALQSDGSVWSWGLNYGTNLGQGTIWGNALSPKRF